MVMISVQMILGLWIHDHDYDSYDSSDDGDVHIVDILTRLCDI